MGVDTFLGFLVCAETCIKVNKFCPYERLPFFTIALDERNTILGNATDLAVAEESEIQQARLRSVWD